MIAQSAFEPIIASQPEYFEEAYSPSSFQDGQMPRIILRVAANIYRVAKVPHTFVVVSLDGSAVAASETGKMRVDRDDTRGWYTEQIDVEINLLDQDGNTSQDFYACQDRPETTMGSSATTSSVGLSFDINAGTFGPIFTPGVGGGLSVSSSFSRNLTDIKLINLTSENVVKHTYRLASNVAARPGCCAPSTLIP